MKLIFDHIGKYKAASILSPVFKLLEACFELTVPLIVSGIIDNGIKKSDMNYVWTQVPILALFASAILTPSLLRSRAVRSSVTWMMTGNSGKMTIRLPVS